jgi:superfamily II DNA or RNA helicase
MTATLPPATAAELSQSTQLCEYGYLVRKEQTGKRNWVREVKRELTAEPQVASYIGGKLPPAVCCWQESGEDLCLPRFYGLQRFGLPQVDRLRGSGEPMAADGLRFSGSLREEQQEPFRLFMEAARDPLRRGGILSLPTGFGKTTVAIKAMCELGRCSLVVVHKAFLMQQWKTRIRQFAPGARVGRLQGPVVDVEGKDFVLGMLQTLCTRRYPIDVVRRFGTLCVDECHHLGAEIFCRALRYIVCDITLGLSATVKRRDGMSKVFIWHLGDVVCAVRGREGDEGVQVRLEMFEAVTLVAAEEGTGGGGGVPLLPNGKPNVARMINQMCESVERNEFIVHLVRDLRAQGRRVLVLSDRRGHLEQLAVLLGGSAECGLYYGGLPPEELSVSEGKGTVLGTFAMAQEGLDIKGIDALLLATPKSDVTQAVGRILREPSGCRSRPPLIVDVVDSSHGIFLGQARKRRTMYTQRGFDVSIATAAAATGAGSSGVCRRHPQQQQQQLCSSAAPTDACRPPRLAPCNSDSEGPSVCLFAPTAPS